MCSKVAQFCFFAFIAFIVHSESFAQDGVGSIQGRVTYRIQKRVKNVVVYVENVDDGLVILPDEPALSDQNDLKFTPFVLPIVKGQRVVFRNSDRMAHNIFTPDDYPDALKFPGVNLRSGEETPVIFKQTGVTTLLCSLHPEMEAYILTLQNPYLGVTSDEEETRGAFEIRNVPEGEYVLKTWSQAFNPSSVAVKVAANQISEVEIALKR